MGKMRVLMSMAAIGVMLAAGAGVTGAKAQEISSDELSCRSGETVNLAITYWGSGTVAWKITSQNERATRLPADPMRRPKTLHLNTTYQTSNWNVIMDEHGEAEVEQYCAPRAGGSGASAGVSATGTKVAQGHKKCGVNEQVRIYSLSDYGLVQHTWTGADGQRYANPPSPMEPADIADLGGPDDMQTFTSANEVDWQVTISPPTSQSVIDGQLDRINLAKAGAHCEPLN